MKNNSKKKKLMAAAAALALIAVLSGTFAWITSQEQRVNRVKSAKVVNDTVTVNEKWEPKPMIPGTEATKEVSVTNSGDASVFVRVSYEEVLKHLTNKGAITFSPNSVPGAKFDPNAENTLASHVPVEFSAVTIGAGSGFAETTDPTTQVTGLEPGVKLFVKGGKVGSDIHQSITAEWTPALVHEYAPGKYQQVKGSVVPTGELKDRTESATGWSFTVSDITYGYYADGYKNAVVNWAKSSLAPVGETTVTGHALLGTQGNRNGVNYDYREATLGIVSPETLPNPTPATDADLIPTANNEAKGVQADLKGLSEGSVKQNHIRVGYGNAITNIAALNPNETDETVAAAAAKKWVYNADDGWFYYTGTLKGGETTADLLKKLIFGENLSTEYTNATFDLVVKLEAIQATETAIKDSTGWGLEGAAADSNTDKIVKQLVSRIGK
ncbi:hypothetical protein JZO70_04405 [Enterococcus sp. 669A]|uniref:Alternate signal-mediated exported protein n=1 Tax=Candidatus Enterococcus moelleringii TaxID=2815325 RepID=A0ABS3L6Z3_9ENTE|nr:hypothetical protein [Enterococcus sp. 669A]MBO1305387.1 hypothetical protein [Enterococcus sp. 669A]